LQGFTFGMFSAFYSYRLNELLTDLNQFTRLLVKEIISGNINFFAGFVVVEYFGK
jgi:hypothetical protein